MTIPARDELIERAHIFADAFARRHGFAADWLTSRDGGLAIDVATLLDSEIRRAVAEELEALRDEVRLRGAVVTFSGEYERGAIGERRLTVNRIDARLADLRAEQTCSTCGATTRDDPRGRVCSNGFHGPRAKQTEHPAPSGAKPSSPRVDAGSSTGPAQGSLSDADVLERAAEIMRAHGYVTSGRNLTEQAAALRAASAPEPVDVFRAFQDFNYRGGFAQTTRENARDWFGPLVDVVKSAAIWEDDLEDLRRLAACALEAIRQRAQEASR